MSTIATQESLGASDAGLVTGIRQGGTGGKPFDDFEFSRLDITSINVHWDTRINAIQMTYENADSAKLHGESVGQSDTFSLAPGEKMVKIEGFADACINQLQFTTDTGRSSPVYGSEEGTYFIWTDPKPGGYLRFFIGRRTELEVTWESEVLISCAHSSFCIDALAPHFQDDYPV